jgi:hypothetical protein
MLLLVVVLLFVLLLLLTPPPTFLAGRLAGLGGISSFILLLVTGAVNAPVATELREGGREGGPMMYVFDVKKFL